jgi:hypothetical protein
MTDWEADPDALVQETMALTKSIRVETPIPRTTADQDVVLTALNEAALIIGDYLELVALHSDYDRLRLAVRLGPGGVLDQRGPRCCEASLAAV